MIDAALTIEAGWQMQTETYCWPVSFDDPARFGYPDAFPGEVVDLIPTAVHTTCEARLTNAEADRIGRALRAGDRLTVQCGSMRLTGWFHLEIDDAGYFLKGEVETIEHV